MEDKNQTNGPEDHSDFKALLDENNYKMPKAGDVVRGKVLSSSRAEVRLDIDGIMTGIIRGAELYHEDEEYGNLKPGDEVEATVIDEENEFGELELSFRHVGQERAWESLTKAYQEKKNVKVRILNANKGGLLVSFRQISGFLPVSQLSP